MRNLNPHPPLAAVLALCIVGLSGCSPFRNAMPASCIRPSFYDSPRGNKEPINFTRLRQEPPAVYLLGPRDVLGIYIGGVLPIEKPNEPPAPPPVHFPENADLPPSIGYPIPVREDGTLSLPLVPPIPVAGLTLAQAENEIRKAYTIESQHLRAGEARIIVTLMRPRKYSVLVVREDSIFNNWGQSQASSIPLGSGAAEPRRFGNTKVAELRAYENDVLHAMAESGGMPGIDAKNEIVILRGGFRNAQGQAETQQAWQDPVTRAQLFATSPNVVRIPLRIGPTDPQVSISPDDVILNTGDIVFIESRQAEVFYTGGLLPGRQIPVPRDYDIDVLSAIAMAGGSIAAGPGSSSTSGMSRGGVGSIFPPTRVVLVRNINGQMQAIKLSLRTAATNPQERILVLPNDFILLEYTEMELFMNILLNNVNLNLSLNQLFNR